MGDPDIPMSANGTYSKAIGHDRSHVIHPFSQLATTEITPDDMYVGGAGCYLEDARGNRLFDANAGLWCVNVGYGRDEMVEAIREQAGRMSYGQIFARNANLPSAELAARIARLAPEGLNRVFLGTGGSIANETAIRTVHHYFRLQGRDSKRFVLSVDQSYHGSTYLAASLTFSGNYHETFHVVDVVHELRSPYPYRAPDGLVGDRFVDYLVDDLERLITRLGADNIACFILEPVLGAGGVIVPPEGYHARMVEVCHANDIFVIADEVVTGFGRLGHFMAAEPVFGMQADLITLGKGISSGYQPLSATLVSDRIQEVISASEDPDRIYAHGFTHSGHPVCCAAGLANIDIMEREDLCGHVTRVGARFQARLRDLSGSSLVGEVRGLGFMAAVELVADRNTKALFPSEVGISGRVEAFCRDEGLIVRPLRQHIILSPPLIMTAEEGDWVVGVIERSLERVESDLRSEGLL
ncbi:MAG: aminotransferase class III-fold pyridoxal phosphate-dependent enzyme [bacterium]|nr:aminotransferase class III-fold pyridoxal phosphate-dependent enzyme [bacterium]